MAVLFISSSYFTLRYESLLLTSQFVALFAIYVFMAFQKKWFSMKEIVVIGILFRLLLLVLTPNLSDDVYRFIWDGKLWWEGIDAYAFLPSQLIKDNILSTELFAKLNSPDYYSIYPPLNQLIFNISAFFDSTLVSIIVIRLFIIGAELGTLFLFAKLLKRYQKDVKLLILYAFNPLVIIELSGNLHFEAFVIFFLLWAIYEYEKMNIHMAAIATGLAISFKLLPLILLASFFRKIPFKQYLKFIFLSFFVAVLSFSPFFFSEAIQGILTSTSLYFKSFEFNASLYYVVREVGFDIKGYNIIDAAGPIMAALSLVGMVLFNVVASPKMKLPERMLWTYSIYFLFATTVHPWYILPILVLGILSDYKFPILWTLTIFLSYWGYTETGYFEPLGLVSFEYISLLLCIVIECIQKAKNIKLYHA